MIRRLFPVLIMAAFAIDTSFTGAWHSMLSGFSLIGSEAHAQSLDMSHGEQISISSAGPQTYDRNAQTVTFLDRTQVVRGDVTIDADQLVGFLRKKAPLPTPSNLPTGAKPATTVTSNSEDRSNHSEPSQLNTMGGSFELYRMEALGHVHIYTKTDQAWGDKALYDTDQAILVMTGKALRLTTPKSVMTARDAMEYHAQTHMSVGRGDATVTTDDGKRIKADVLVAFSKPDVSDRTDSNEKGNDGGEQKVQTSKLDRAYAWGHVVLRTPNETATGDRGVYVFDTQMARLIGNVHITSGQNQNNGASAIVNMKTGVAIMNPAPGQRVEGLVIPNEAASRKPGDAP